MCWKPANIYGFDKNSRITFLCESKLCSVIGNKMVERE
jgi:hypothetical protein